MKRINIYITDETNQTIDNLADMFSESRSEVIRKAITEYHDKYSRELTEFMCGIDDLIESNPAEVPVLDAMEELEKCKNLEYFLNNYIMIVTPDTGIVKFNPRKYQMALAESYTMYRRIIINQSRQMGTSTLTCAYILHDILFSRDKTYGIFNTKQGSASATLNILKGMIANMPDIMKPFFQVTISNKTQLQVNGNYVLARSSSVDSIRGTSLSFMYMENFAGMNRETAEDFMASVFPTLMSYPTSKIILASTPNGLNSFYKLWTDAISDYNDFRPINLHYSLHEDSGVKAQYESLRTVIGNDAFEQEYNCNFITRHRGVLYGV